MTRTLAMAVVRLLLWQDALRAAGSSMPAADLATADLGTQVP